jgi:hypothetical protein
MLIIVFFALLRTNTASFLTNLKKLVGEMRVSHYKSGSLETNVSTIARKLNATCHHGDVSLLQTPGTTGLTCEGTVHQFLNHAGLLIA